MKYLFSTILFTLTLISYGQQDSTLMDSFKNPSHVMQVKTESDKIIIRWAPGNYAFFREGVDYGYLLQRRAYKSNPDLEYSEEIDIDGDFKTIKVVHPWTENEWKQNAIDTSDIYAGVAMQIQLSGEASPTSSDEVSRISTYYEDQQRRFAFALLAADFSRTAALGLGLRYEDTNVKQGYFYEYRLLYSKLTDGLEQDTVYAWADMNQPYESKPVDHCFLEASDKAITVYWTRHNDQFFTAYDIEKSTDKLTWTKLNNKPWMTSLYNTETPNFYIDSIAENNKTYFYRIRGYTLFAEKGEYSIIMGDKGIDETPPAPPWGVKAEDMGGYVALQWEAMPNESDFDGFYIERSDKANGYFEKISDKLPKEAREFADLQPDQLSQNYYRVVSIDTLGNESYSFSDLGYILDSVPPSKPTGLIGVIDTFGIVKLDWTPGPEADIIGYRVYWSNNKNNEFTQMEGEVIPGINYVDSIKIKTLNEEIYYKIVAVDHRYNHSEYSEVLTIKKPDLVPPSAPLIYDYQLLEKSVMFRWHPTVSDDAISQTVLKQKTDGSWDAVYTPSHLMADSFTDTEVIKGQSYNYKVIVEDDAGNTSESQVFQITVVDNGIREVNLEANYKIIDKVVNLNWTLTTEEAKFLLYKSRGDDFKKITSLKSPIHSWKDLDYLPGDQYKMRVIFKDGNESQIILFKEVK